MSSLLNKLSGLKVLVVDDDADLCDMFADEMLFAGAQVYKANGGISAIKLLAENHIDIVLTDINMPEGDGIELLAKIKSDFKNVKIVFLNTGYSEYKTEDFYHAGASGVFEKPYNIEIVIEAISRLLKPLAERFAIHESDASDTFIVERNFKNFNAAVADGLLGVAQGGIFISTENKYPWLGQKVRINIKFTDENLVQNETSYTGICRWVRKEINNNLKTGYGVEFTEMNEKSFSALFEVLNVTKSEAYIPKC